MKLNGFNLWQHAKNTKKKKEEIKLENDHL